MRELKTLREGWESVAREETRLLRSLSVQQSAQDLLLLQETFESQLQQTAHLFASDRWAALIELQSKLLRLARWMAKDEQSVHFGSKAAKPSS